MHAPCRSCCRTRARTLLSDDSPSERDSDPIGSPNHGHRRDVVLCMTFWPGLNIAGRQHLATGQIVRHTIDGPAARPSLARCAVKGPFPIAPPPYG